MYFLRYEWPCCIEYTKPSRRFEILYPIKRAHEYCKVLKIEMHLSNQIYQLYFGDAVYFS